MNWGSISKALNKEDIKIADDFAYVLIELFIEYEFENERLFDLSSDLTIKFGFAKISSFTRDKVGLDIKKNLATINVKDTKFTAEISIYPISSSELQKYNNFSLLSPCNAPQSKPLK